jgi:hypothetical protein
MATLDWSQCPAVERIPDGGAWVFKGTRTPVAVVRSQSSPQQGPVDAHSEHASGDRGGGCRNEPRQPR